MLVHEVAHIQRCHHLVMLLQELARALYWPIVSVHGLNRELERAREDLCDNFVLEDRDALSYGETLLHIAELSLGARPTGATVGNLHWRGKLEQRIAGLLDPTRSKTTRTNRGMAFVVMFLFIAGVAIASATRLGPRVVAAQTGDATVADNAPSNAQEPNLAAVSVASQAAPPIQKAGALADLDDPKLAGHYAGRVVGPDGKTLGGRSGVHSGRMIARSRKPGPSGPGAMSAADSNSTRRTCPSLSSTASPRAGKGC